MKSRQRIAQLESELAVAHRENRRLVDANRTYLERLATAESARERIPGVCPDRATCLRTTSAADAWRNHQREAS